MNRSILIGALSLCLNLPVLAEGPALERTKHALGLALATPLAVIPTLANTPGRFGAFFKTRVVIHNLTSNSYTLDAILFGPNGIVGQESIPLSANQYRSYDNFLQDVFNFRGAGAVVLAGDINSLSLDEADLINDAPYKFSVTAEVYSDSPNGRYTTTVVNGIVPLVDSGPRAFSAGITVGQDRRVNVGVFNLGVSTIPVKAIVHDSSGFVTQTIDFSVGALSWQQKTVSRPVDNGFIRWQIDARGGLPFIWAVSVDNRSNDGTLTWPARPGVTLE
ncbi:MAG: hypothetical protein OXG96_02245 [Acidobacteria bacterium]|nr:hypothetical protein [Acidobacteriota bacterium]